VRKHWAVEYTEKSSEPMQQFSSYKLTVKHFSTRGQAEIFAAEYVAKAGGEMAIYEAVGSFKREESVVSPELEPPSGAA
jgi:hypothetical protein